METDSSTEKEAAKEDKEKGDEETGHGGNEK